MANTEVRIKNFGRTETWYLTRCHNCNRDLAYVQEGRALIRYCVPCGEKLGATR